MNKRKIRDCWYALREALDEMNWQDLWVLKYDKSFESGMLIIQQGLKQEGIIGIKLTQAYEITLDRSDKASDVVVTVQAESQTDALIQVMKEYMNFEYDMIKIRKVPNED